MSRTTNSEVLEKVKYVLSDEENHFCCAITCEVMDDPVIDPCTLNQAAMQWFSASKAEQEILDCGNFKEVPRYDRKTLEKLIGFAQGLYYLVKVDQDASWRPEPFNRALKLKHDNFSYFPLPLDPRSGLGFDFAISLAAAGRPFSPPASFLAMFFQKLLSSKNSWLSEHYAASLSVRARPV